MRPLAASPVWSMFFAFDRVADGRALKYLTVVDDGTHESVAVTPVHAIGRRRLTRLLDRLAWWRGLLGAAYSKIIRTNNSKEFTSDARPVCNLYVNIST